MKNSLLKSIIILIIGGFITKLLGMITKIVLTRSITTEVLGLYMMLTPTLILIINLSSTGIPTAISKLVADDNYNNKKIIFSILPLVIITNLFIIVILFIIAPYLANNLLKNNNLYLGIISIALLIPFINIATIIRSYLFGKNNVFPLTLSNILEQLTKLIIFLYLLPIIKYKKTSYIIAFLILSNIISEIIEIITMMSFLPKNIDLKKSDLIPKITYIKDSLSISIPNSASKLIGSIGYFLEPIILTSALHFVGYSTKYITYNYGIINGYVIPLILLPSFFTSAISQALLPNISKDYSNGNIKKVKSKLKLSVFLSGLIGFASTIIILLIPELLLRFIYHTNKGVNYLRILAPIFFIEHLSSPLSATLEAIGKGTYNMMGTLIGTMVGIISLFILSLFKIGFYSLIISTTLHIIVSTIYLYFKTDKFLS